MNSSKGLKLDDDRALLEAFYRAENIDSLLTATEEYLRNIGIEPQISIAFQASDRSAFTVQHRSNSIYQHNQILTLNEDNKGNFWVAEYSTPDTQSNVVDIARRLAVPLYADGEITGCLILEKNHNPISQNTIDTLSTLLARNVVRIELSQLYIRQHQHDSVKLSSIDRMKSVMRELELSKVQTGLIELIMSTVSGCAACFVLSCSESGDLKTTTEFGVTQNDLDSLIHNDLGSITDYVIQKQQAWLTTERTEFTEFQQSPFLERLSSFLSLPLSVRDGSGCIFIADPENVTENALDIALTIVQLSRISIDNALLHAQVVERAIHKQQLEIAGEVQTSLLPKLAPKTTGISVYGLNVPCDDSSGDYYDFIELPDKRLCFVLADATGHGIGAAILATTARAMLRALLCNQSNNIDLASICTTLNTLLDSDLAADKFITMFIGLYDPFSKSLVYASAGHDPPLVMYQPSKDCFTDLECTGLPFGMFPNMGYEVSNCIQLEPGTILTLLSDGIPEAINSDEQMYGKEKLQEFIRNNKHYPPEKLCRAIADDVIDFRNSAPQTDDITIVTLCVDRQVDYR